MCKKHSFPLSAAVAFALSFLAHSSARADQILWGYNWQPSTTRVNATSGSGWLALTNEPGSTASGSSNTVITNIQAHSTAPFNAPDVFTKAPITFTLTLKDNASGATQSVNFSGLFSGTITADSSNVHLGFAAPTTQTLSIGGNSYTVQVGTFTPPGPPDAKNSGSLNAYVTVVANTGGGGISSVPEPATLALAGLALPCLGLTWGWRRRKCIG